MSKYKQSLLSLCWLLVFSVGFLSVGSLKAHAIYSDNLPNGFTIKWYKDENPTLTIRDTSYNVLQTVTSGDIATVNEYGFSNKAFNNVGYLFFTNHTYPINFQYLPQVYDYYLIATVVSGNGVTESGFSFVPEVVGWWDYECNGIEDVVYSTDVVTYHHDDGNTTGFTTVAKLPAINNTALKGFHFEDPQGGVFPASIRLTPVMVAVPKNSSTSGDFGAIIEKLDEVINEINDQTWDLMTWMRYIQETIIEQYEMSDNENFGVGDITNNVEEKLGVLAFTSDTLVNFLDLFTTDGSGGTELILPGFELNMGNGESYQVWNDQTYDLIELEQQFGFLINTVRTITVLCVWLALFKYLGKAYEHFINKR